MMGPEIPILKVFCAVFTLLGEKNWRAVKAEFTFIYRNWPWNWLDPDFVT